MVMKISKQRLKEIIKEETQGQLVEQEQLDEAIFGGVGLVLLGKLFMILSQRSNIQKVLDALKSRSDELPPEAVTLIAGVEGALDVVEENLPKTIDSLTNKAGKWNPSNWATNIFVTILSKVVKKDTETEQGETV
tara:strand:+ start:1750 stop:2154 length:405 start_codon:yes stop_codon:yes gene_type:complete